MKRKMSFPASRVFCLLCRAVHLGAERGRHRDRHAHRQRSATTAWRPDRYVEVATYHWSELYHALPLYLRAAYSFFRGTDDGTYHTVIDSAYGFYLCRPVWTTPGFTAARSSARSRSTPATRASAFSPPSPMPTCSARSATILMTSPRTFSPVCDENGSFDRLSTPTRHGTTAGRCSPCWRWRTAGPAMRSAPSTPRQTTASLGTGNRFRLLFGQSYPLERRTNQTAKYTHTLFM